MATPPPTGCRPSSRAAQIVAILALSVALVAGGCGRGGSGASSAPCDDSVTPSDAVPPEMRDRLAAHDLTEVVGEGAVWFIAPTTPTWSAVVQEEGDLATAKLPLWVDRDGPLPTITVRREDGEGPRGSASAAPTTEGLPGPVPARITFPGAGCWVVEATAGTDVARLRVRVR